MIWQKLISQYSHNLWWRDVEMVLLNIICINDIIGWGKFSVSGILPRARACCPFTLAEESLPLAEIHRQTGFLPNILKVGVYKLKWGQWLLPLGWAVRHDFLCWNFKVQWLVNKDIEVVKARIANLNKNISKLIAGLVGCGLLNKGN